MNHRPPCVSRADLLRLMDEDGDIDAHAAAACGYGLGISLRPRENPRGKSGLETASTKEEEHPVSTSRAPVEMAPWPFFRVLEFEAKGAVPERRSGESLAPLSNKDLRVRLDRPELPFAPLVPWRRLVVILRGALGRSVGTYRVHDRKLSRMLARGLPLTSLPRLKRRAWAPEAVLLCDRSWREMAPFQEDVDHLLELLRREMGKAALKIIELNGPPTMREIARFSTGVPVLALSTLGQYQGDPHILTAWAVVAKLLSQRGHPVAALCPCPRWHWREKICAAWPLTIWDGRPRAARRVAWQHPLERCEKANEATGKLLDLLSPSALVERRLLRAARFILGSPADVGCEWEAWFHPNGWASSDSFGLVMASDTASAGAQARRLERRANHPLSREVDELIFIQHGRHGLLIELEARIRALSSGQTGHQEIERLVEYLKRAVERLRAMDPAAEDTEDYRSNLAPSFVEMVDRIPPKLRAHPELAEVLAEGLGHAHRFMRTVTVQWHEGLAVATALRAYETDPLFPEKFRDYQLGLLPTDEGKQLGLIPLPQETLKGVTHCGAFSALSRHSLITIRKGSYKVTQPVPFEAGFTPLGNLVRGVQGEIRIESGLEILKCQSIQRPTWARRMWYDRFGLAAEFRVKGVPFVLRWIPPGRFLMGSPEDEPRRWNAEGPRHERVIEKGFWLGETVVTQGQWRAVMIRENPSRFKGPESLPVEQVSWDLCDEYCSRLSALVPGLAFRLPKEEEWEYACRAGTDTALWTGGITIQGENDAPELDAIAWYGGNSGQELEVKNPYDAKDWPKRQYPDKEAGTHAVKGKEANPWGLFDMLGNVWEWCEDAWDEKAYEKRADVGSALEAGEGAGRVVRGGSWGGRARDCRAACRSRGRPDNRRANLGFRLAAGQELGAASSVARRAMEDSELPGSGATVPERRSRARRAGGTDPA